MTRDSPSPSDPPAPQLPAATPAVRRRLQMADIARLAGVSVATVSRALNGSPLISAQTRDRVGQLARSMNYAINTGAKNLRLQRNRTVGVVIPFDRRSRQHVSDPFFLSMLGSLADAATERGHDLLLSRADADADSADAVARLVDAGTVPGVILIGQWRLHAALNGLADRGLPLVVWGARMADQRYCTVGGDNVAGGELATAHLLQRGRRRIVFIGDTALPEVADRHRGHVRAHAALGLAPDLALTLPIPFDPDQAHAAVAHLCASGVRFDAVFACSDVLANAAMRAVHAHGLSVPADVAVVGYDDIDWSRHTHPPLTTVHQPIEAAGVALVDALLHLIDGKAVPPRLLGLRLVERASSG